MGTFYGVECFSIYCSPRGIPWISLKKNSAWKFQNPGCQIQLTFSSTSTPNSSIIFQDVNILENRFYLFGEDYMYIYINMCVYICSESVFKNICLHSSKHICKSLRIYIYILRIIAWVPVCQILLFRGYMISGIQGSKGPIPKFEGCTVSGLQLSFLSCKIVRSIIRGFQGSKVHTSLEFQSSSFQAWGLYGSG